MEYFVQGGSRIYHNNHNKRNSPAPTSSTKPDSSQNYGEQVLRSRSKADLLRPAVKTDSFIREGLNVHEGLHCYVLPVWGCLVLGCCRGDYDLGTIPNLQNHICTKESSVIFSALLSRTLRSWVGNGITEFSWIVAQRRLLMESV